MKKGMFVTMMMGVVYTLALGALLLTFSAPVMRLFNQEQDVIACGMTAMRYFCPFYWALSVMHSLAGTVRGTDKSVPPMAILILSLCVFRIVWITFIMPRFDAIDGVFVLYPVSWILGMILMSVYTWKGNWFTIPEKIDDLHEYGKSGTRMQEQWNRPCMMVLPTVIRHFAETAQEAIKQIAVRIGVFVTGDAVTDAENAANAIFDFCIKLGMKPLQETLKEKGYEDDEQTFIRKMDRPYIICHMSTSLRSRSAMPILHFCRRRKSLIFLPEPI